MLDRLPRSRTVDCNDPAASYSYGAQPSSSGGGWFSGLRSRISALTGMSEWLSQLGIQEEKNEATIKAGVVTRTAGKTGTAMSASAAAPSAVSPREPSSARSHSVHDDFAFQPIALTDDPTSPDADCGTWDFSESFWMDLDGSGKADWGDTLERQHFGPLRDLITVGGSHKATGHDFQPIALLYPTWCDKCGDFIWGLLKQAIKCQKCNYTCHDRCECLVTLDCRSPSNSIDSSLGFPTLVPVPSQYPQIPTGTLGTIPKGTVLPPMPHVSPDATIKGGLENPLFCPSPAAAAVSPPKAMLVSAAAASPVRSPVKTPSATLPRGFAPSSSGSSEATTPGQTAEQERRGYRVEEVYVKEDTPFVFSQQGSLAERIRMYNETADGLGMVMAPDGETFSGYLQIRMNFTRPINVVAGEKPPTVYDVVNTARSTCSLRTITSFFLPRNTVKVVNINSTMTTRQMIVTLLRKFKVADNPRKFAVYVCRDECDEAQGTLLRKLVRVGDEVCPLQMALSWGRAGTDTAFVLQENDTGDIEWDAFEVPELENFLRILNMEEQQYQWQARQKYNAYRYYIDAELRERGVSVEGGGEGRERASAPPEEMHLRGVENPFTDPFGTSSSMVFTQDAFHTAGEGTLKAFSKTNQESFAAEEEPMYVNVQFMRENGMGASTQL